MISPILWMAVCAWAIAQGAKMVINLVVYHKVDWKSLTSSGGMPSSHSALVCACATGVGVLYGLNTPMFAMAVVLALVVMYDAANVRKATGEQAKVLNCMMRSWSGEKPELLKKELKEMLGHTPFQVAMGALLGVAVGVVGSLIAF